MISLGDEIFMQIMRPSPHAGVSIPLYEQKVHAGFPDAMEDTATFDKVESLNDILVENPVSTFYGRMKGNAMAEEGISDGDILVIDKSVEAQDGDLIIASYNGTFYLRYLLTGDDGKTRLSALSRQVPDIIVRKEDRFSIWGVVTYTIEKKH